jgi:GH24 family phage-related lysozyme (muramidase)
MRTAVADRFVDFTGDLEGVVPWMYQDIKGLVTVAIGNLIDPIQYALPLPFKKHDGSYATRDEIAADWLRVKRHPDLAKWGHRPAEQIAQLRLDDDGIELVVSRKLAQNVDHLRRRFREWDEWPACAQLATLSMAWACGPAFQFPMLAAVLNAQDFAEAAKHCHINDAGNPGLVPRNRRNKTLYRNAARVRDFKLDPDYLNWSTDLDVTERPTEPAIDNPASAPTFIGDIVHPRLFTDEDPPRSISIDDDDGEPG